jgi:hypothetical protein
MPPDGIPLHDYWRKLAVGVRFHILNALRKYSLYARLTKNKGSELL